MRAGQKVSSGKIIRNLWWGDNVEITVLDAKEKEGNLIRILPRKNFLIRPAVANVDQAFVIFAMEDPSPNFLLLDRFLIMMEQAGFLP